MDHFCRLVRAKLTVEFNTAKRGWQHPAAEVVGVSQGTISKLWTHEERPLTGMDVVTLVTFADWLGVSLDVALGRAPVVPALSREELRSEVRSAIAEAFSLESSPLPSGPGEYAKRSATRAKK